jgi:hypothetical protein
MGAPLIKGGGPSRKRKKKQGSSYHLGEGKSKGEKSISHSSAPPHKSKPSLFPHIFPISSTPHHKKLIIIIIIIIIIKESLKLSPICTAHTH